jgi:hypothetical protein
MIGQINVADHLVLERAEIAQTLAVTSPESTATSGVVPSSVSIQMLQMLEARAKSTEVIEAIS